MWFLRSAVPLAEIPIACDVHTHLLPGRDDGFTSTEESLKALTLCHRKGLRRVALTPHIEPERYPQNTRGQLEAAFTLFMEQVPAGMDIQITLAAEYMCDDSLDSQPSLLCFKDRTVLIEMSYYFPSPGLKQILFDLTTNGYQPVLAHPERYAYYASHPEVFDELHAMGCRFQLNLMSLGGVYGRESLRILNYLDRQHLYHFAGSDLHSVTQWERLQRLKISRSRALLVEKLAANNAALL